MVVGYVSCGLATCIILLELRVIRDLLASTERLALWLCRGFQTRRLPPFRGRGREFSGGR